MQATKQIKQLVLHMYAAASDLRQRKTTRRSETFAVTTHAETFWNPQLGIRSSRWGRPRRVEGQGTNLLGREDKGVAHSLRLLGEVRRGWLHLRLRRRRRAGLALDLGFGGVVLGLRVGVERVWVAVGEAVGRRVPLQRAERVDGEHRHLVQLVLQLRDDVHGEVPLPPADLRLSRPLLPPLPLLVADEARRGEASEAGGFIGPGRLHPRLGLQGPAHQRVCVWARPVPGLLSGLLRQAVRVCFNDFFYYSI